MIEHLGSIRLEQKVVKHMGTPLPRLVCPSTSCSGPCTHSACPGRLVQCPHRSRSPSCRRLPAEPHRLACPAPFCTPTQRAHMPNNEKKQSNNKKYNTTTNNCACRKSDGCKLLLCWLHAWGTAGWVSGFVKHGWRDMPSLLP